MANFNPTVRATAQVEAATTPTIYNVIAAVAGTEYSQGLSTSTKRFTIKVRGNAVLKYAYVSGESGINYITIGVGAVADVGGLNFSGTLYFQTNKNTMTVEIEEWA